LIFLGRFSSSFSRLQKKLLQGGQTVSIDERTGSQALECGLNETAPR
jgi:hypothetical protein